MPVGRIGAMLFGGIYGICGLVYLVHVMDVRNAEEHAFGTPESHVAGFAFAIFLMAVGLFLSHVGIIYYWRKLRCWALRRRERR
jgi:hypothetical protein